MKNPNFKLLPVAVLAAALVAACGGRVDAPPVVAPVSGVPVPGDIATNVASFVSYTDQLIATGENGEPVDINALTLASDETSDAAPVVF